MAFWSDAFADLGDNVTLLEQARQDFWDNLNPFSDSFLTGDAPKTAAEVERQLAADQGREVDQDRIDRSSTGGLARIGDAAVNTGKDVGHLAGDALDAGGKVAGGALDLLTNPWFLGAAALVVGLAVAAPYLAPVVARVAK